MENHDISVKHVWAMLSTQMPLIGLNPCNKYEHITTSYLLSVLEYNIHETSKGVEC